MIPVVIVLAVVIVLSFLILTIAVCCYGRRRKRQGARTGGDVPLVPLPQQGYIPPCKLHRLQVLVCLWFYEEFITTLHYYDVTAVSAYTLYNNYHH